MGARSVGDILEKSATNIYTVDQEAVIGGVEKYVMSDISWTTSPFKLVVKQYIATTAEIDDLVTDTSLSVSTEATSDLLAAFAATTA